MESRIRAVPASVPSVFHSPLATLKKRTPLVPSGVKTANGNSGEKSFTSTVPASVPSLFHSVSPVQPPPFSAPKAVKRRVPLRSTRRVGPELAGPGRISLTRTVPAAVPSLFHSSLPVSGWKALKKSVPLIFRSRATPAEPAPGTMSLTRTVPAAVPSLFHSSLPVSGRKALKKRVPSTSVSCLRSDEPGPG